MSETREEFVHALIRFIDELVGTRRGVVAVNINAATPLFQSGLIDSLGILDLLAFVERATGRPVPIRKVDMRFFGTVDRIAQAFWSEVAKP